MDATRKSSAAATARQSVEIVNDRGLHARAAARFVKLAETFDADVTVIRGGIEVSGGSIMGLMMLAAGPGSEIEIVARGREAEAAVTALARMVRERFGES